MCVLYEILNNATVAAILAVILAGLLARYEYRRQRKLDRDLSIKKEIIDNIVFLQEKTDYVLLIIDRIVNSYNITTETDVDFFREVLEKYEIPRLSNAINEAIPAELLKISMKINTYFNHNKKIGSQYEIFKSELKNWHNPIVNRKFDLKQKVKDQAILSKNKFDQESKKFIDIIWKEKIN